MLSAEISTQHTKQAYGRFSHKGFTLVLTEADLINPCPAEPGYTLPLQTV